MEAVTIRLDKQALAELDAVAAWYTSETPAVHTRSDMIRMCIARWLDDNEDLVQQALKGEQS